MDYEEKGGKKLGVLQRGCLAGIVLFGVASILGTVGVLLWGEVGAWYTGFTQGGAQHCGMIGSGGCSIHCCSLRWAMPSSW